MPTPVVYPGSLRTFEEIDPDPFEPAASRYKGELQDRVFVVQQVLPELEFGLSLVQQALSMHGPMIQVRLSDWVYLSDVSATLL